MSQARMRKASNVGESGRPRPLIKASGDVHKEQKEPIKAPQQHRSKTRIPKNLRYDLENALVGLCDVWFEDIKPHLLKNNIRLHVHGAGGGEAEAGGDRGRLPPGAPGCSHLDPGAATDSRRQHAVSSAGYCSTLQATSKARLHKQRQRSIKLLSPLPSPTTISIPEKRNFDESIMCSPKTGQQRYRFQPTHPSAVLSFPKASPTRSLHCPCNSSLVIQPPHSMKHPCGNCRQLEVYLSELVTSPRTKDQATQTAASRSRRRSPQRRQKARSSNGSKDIKTKEKVLPELRKKSPVNKSLSPVRQQKSPPPVQHSPTSQYQSNPISPLRKGSRSLFAPPTEHRQQSPTPNMIPAPSVPFRNREYYHDDPYQDDLYQMIGATYDLHLMYESPRREESPATLTLISSPDKKERVKPPWR